MSESESGDSSDSESTRTSTTSESDASGNTSNASPDATVESVTSFDRPHTGAGGFEEESALVLPWRKTKHILQSMGIVKVTLHSSQHFPTGAGEPVVNPGPTPQHGKEALNNTSAGSQSAIVREVKRALSTVESARSRFSSVIPSRQNGHAAHDVRLQKSDDHESLDNLGLSYPELSSLTRSESAMSAAGGHSQRQNNQRSSRGYVLPITIPHGFQMTRSILHNKPTIKSVIYVSSTNSDSFAILDSHRATILRGSVKAASHPTNVSSSPVAGLNRWIYVKKWRVTVVATMHLELKLLGLSLETLSTTSSVTPVLSLEFNEEHDELIAGGVSNIRIWTFRKEVEMGMPVYHYSTPRLVISDLNSDEWVSFTCYDRKSNRLFAACENHIFIYDYGTGKRLDSMREIHELSITTLALYEPLHYLITGSRDSTVKVWTRFNFLILELKPESYSPVSGIVIPTTSGKVPPQPFLIVSSEDGSIRMWNLENGHCAYKLETDQECLGIGWIRRDTFFSHTRDRIMVWNLNRYYSTFAYSSSEVLLLDRVEVEDLPARILTASADGSVHLISPVTGASLLTSFPIIRDTVLRRVEYDIIAGTLWVLTKGGDIAVFSCRSNPTKIVDDWKYHPPRARISCMTALRALPPPITTFSETAVESKRDLKPVQSGPVFALLAGTDSGQIVMLDVHVLGGRELTLVQAHSAEVVLISCYSQWMVVVSAGHDGTVKVWKLSFTDAAYDTADDGHSISLGVTSSPPLALAPISSVSSNFLLSLPSNSIPLYLCLNLQAQTLAIGTSSAQLLFFRCGPDGLQGQKRVHPADEDHTQKITCIAESESLGLFASSSLDGTVKIWDASDATLARELQFNEAIFSVTFCNSRGDLLVGKSEEILLVRLQDYLPIHILREVYSRPQGWPDDIIESPSQFDSTIDFWELYRLRMEKLGVDLSKWHVKFAARNELDEEMTRRIEELERRRQEAEWRRLQGLKPEGDKKRQKRFDLVTVAPDEFLFLGLPRHKAADGAGEQGLLSDETHTESRSISDDDQSDGSLSGDEHLKRRTEAEDLVVRRRVEFTGLRPISASNRRAKVDHKRRGSVFDKSKRKDSKEVPSLKPAVEMPQRSSEVGKNASISRQGKLVQDLDRERGAAAQPWRAEKPVLPTRAERMAAVAPPGGDSNNKGPAESGSVRQKANQKTKYWIQERMAKLGILPNSAIAGEVGDERRRRERERLERERRENEELERSKEEKKKERPKYLQSRRAPKIPPPPVIILDVKDIVDLEDNDDMENRRKSELIATKAKEEADRIEAEKARILEEQRLRELEAARLEREENERKAKEEAERLAREKELEEAERRRKVEAEIDARRREDMKRRAKTRKRKAKEGAQAPSEEQPGIEKTEEQEQPGSKLSLAPLHDSETTTLPEIVRLQTPQITIDEPKTGVEEPTQFLPSISPMESQHSLHASHHSLHSLAQSRASSASCATDADSEAAHLQFEGSQIELTAEEKVEARHAWNLIERVANASVDGFDRLDNPELARVMNYAWFPGMQGKPVTLKNVVEILLRVMKHGFWQEKCEASVSLLYLYRTFQRDFEKPMEDIIAPQLEFTHDENWQFRAQTCINLGAYKIFHTDIIFSLIGRLRDRSEAVRKAARRSLAEFGITSRDSLRNIMIHMKLVEGRDDKDHYNRLDVLLERLQNNEEELLLMHNDLVEKWRREIHPAIQGKPFPRPTSSSVTLVSPQRQPRHVRVHITGGSDYASGDGDP
ncbi:hypothetical protein DFJ73DRAFT_796190, partial [Zopfochytrium polystomum]